MITREIKDKIRKIFLKDQVEGIFNVLGFDASKRNPVTDGYIALKVAQIVDSTILYSHKLDIGFDDGYDVVMDGNFVRRELSEDELRAIFEEGLKDSLYYMQWENGRYVSSNTHNIWRGFKMGMTKSQLERL